MKTRAIIVIALLLVLFAASLLLIRFYKLELVHIVVLNSVMQKAPSGFPSQAIEQSFTEARERAERQNQEEAYLVKLLRISQRLEKIQHLREEELMLLLKEINP